MALEITDANFDELVTNSDKPIIVDFWAEWCGPCRMVGPLVVEIGEEYKDKAIEALTPEDFNLTLLSDQEWTLRDIVRELAVEGMYSDPVEHIDDKRETKGSPNVSSDFPSFEIAIKETINDDFLSWADQEKTQCEDCDCLGYTKKEVSEPILDHKEERPLKECRVPPLDFARDDNGAEF